MEGVTEGEFELCIYNLTGKPVRMATETVVDVADLAKGCYLVKVTTAEAEEVFSRCPARFVLRGITLYFIALWNVGLRKVS